MNTPKKSEPVYNREQIAAILKKGSSLAVADQILIDPCPGMLNPRVQALLSALIDSGASAEGICQTLIRLGMNFAGRDAEIVGYSPAEAAGAFDAVLHALATLPADFQKTMSATIHGFLADMKSVNLANSLPGLLAERIEEKLDQTDPGVSFLRQIKQLFRD